VGGAAAIRGLRSGGGDQEEEEEEEVLEAGDESN
jgi:hypothetical protein